MSNLPSSYAGRNITATELPADATLEDARRHVYALFRRDEMVWTLGERYDPTTPAWDIDVLRQGTAGRWVKQRHRFDASAQILYFLGESSLSDDEFRATRRTGTLISLANQ